MTTNTCNGWTNYETWNVNLWIDNEEGSQRYWRAMAQECWNDAEADRTFTRDEVARFNLADRLKSDIGESMPNLGATMWADLLGAALEEVDWQEIAEHMIDDVEKKEPELADAE
jgi:hypothetical protein